MAREPWPVALTDSVGVGGGQTFTVTAELTRPANATPYTAHDIIAAQASGVTVAFLEWDTSKAGSSGYISKVQLKTNRTAEAGTYRLHLYRVAQTGLATNLTNLGDNDPFPMLYANRTFSIGYVDFLTFVTAGSGSDAASSLVTGQTSGGNLLLKYGLAAADSKIYGLFTSLVAQTPQSAQAYSIALSFESNS